MPRLSLAQQLAQLDDTAPVDFDPEALQPDGSEDSRNVDLAAAREHYIDVGPSSLRKLQNSLADPKYDGVRVSRQALIESNEGSDEDDEDLSTSGSNGLSDGEVEPSESEGEGEDTTSEMENEDEDTDNHVATSQVNAVPPKPLSTEQEPSEDLTSTLKRTREADRKKGKAVARQIALWDALLDSRIRIQKAVVAANKLPMPDALHQVVEAPECADAMSKLCQEALGLADDLFELQERLLEVNEGVTPPPRKRRKADEYENPSQYSNELICASEAAAAIEAAYHPHLVQTLTKWSSKIQAVAPSVLLPSNRGAFAKGKQHVKSATQLVDEVLLDQPKLLARTRLRRSPGSRIGSTPIESDQLQEDPELFDDTDFYQKMLRDIIDSRGDGKRGTSDWMAIQKQKKAKKAVDTKASKGRKLRYDAHEKIQNFMVPVPVPGAWHDEQIDELFSSILGKGFENVVLNDDGGMGADDDQQVEAALGSGFRVF